MNARVRVRVHYVMAANREAARPRSLSQRAQTKGNHHGLKRFVQCEAAVYARYDIAANTELADSHLTFK